MILSRKTFIYSPYHSRENWVINENVSRPEPRGLVGERTRHDYTTTNKAGNCPIASGDVASDPKKDRAILISINGFQCSQSILNSIRKSFPCF